MKSFKSKFGCEWGFRASVEGGEGGIFFNTLHFSLFLTQSYRSKKKIGVSQSAHNQHLHNVSKYKQFAILNQNLFA